MPRRIVALAAAAAATAVGAPAVAEADPMPRAGALDAYSALWHKCRDLTYCKAGRNVRREGIRFKWRSENGERRHWGTRPAYAADVADHIRVLRRKTVPRYWSGGWVIPAYIVMCESHGQNLPPNGAGASGYYQVIPGTWAAHGGLEFASAAYLATRAQQDIIATRIWNSGGPSQWDCA